MTLFHQNNNLHHFQPKMKRYTSIMINISVRYNTDAAAVTAGNS